MKPTRAQLELIEKLGLRGTMLEQLVLTPGAIDNLEQATDSPSLMRFALDVRRALADTVDQPVLVRRSASR
jgi:hypothetical protein